MQSKLKLGICTLMLAASIAGCKNYSVSINDNQVYTPPGIFKDFKIADRDLFNCVQQTIYDRQITRAEQLTRLNCNSAAIQSLDGLEKFFALKELNLANNKLSNIEVIAKLGRLEVLLLNDNQIQDPTPLLSLLHLKNLRLEGNASLSCTQALQLSASIPSGADIRLPSHCTP